jgi:hypothetical protein
VIAGVTLDAASAGVLEVGGGLTVTGQLTASAGAAFNSGFVATGSSSLINGAFSLTNGSLVNKVVLYGTTGNAQFDGTVTIGQVAAAGSLLCYGEIRALDNDVFSVGNFRVVGSRNSSNILNAYMSALSGYGIVVAQNNAGSVSCVLNGNTGEISGLSLKFGTYVATPSSVIGYMTVTDAAGNTRKLAVIS